MDDMEYLGLQTIERDGITYTITLSRCGGQYSALWRCDTCSLDGTAASLHDQQDHATSDAMRNVVLHHQMSHAGD